MPELPEVETVRLQLIHKVVGKTILRVKVHHPKTTVNDAGFSQTLKNKTISGISRVGKLLIFDFLNESDLFLLVHLKMTGQFFYVDEIGNIIGGGHSQSPNDSKQLPNRHTRVSFIFTDKTILHFNDMRLFGYTKLATKSEVTKAKLNYGPEPIDDNNFDVNWFGKTLQNKRSAIKAILLNQAFIAGLGNIYVDEVLWAAKVSPQRPANLVSAAEAKQIAKYAGQIMTEAIKVGGTTFQHFLDTDGTKGNYTKKLKVFGKQNTPCPRCGHLIEKIRVAGRGTHFCPQCQK